MWSPDGSRVVCLGRSGVQRFLVGKPEQQVARTDHGVLVAARRRMDPRPVHERVGLACRGQRARPCVSRRPTSRSGRRSGHPMGHGWGSLPIAPTGLGTTRPRHRGRSRRRGRVRRAGSPISAARRPLPTWAGPREVVFTGRSERAAYVAQRRAVHRRRSEGRRFGRWPTTRPSRSTAWCGRSWLRSIDEPGPIPLGDGRYVVMGHSKGSSSAYLVDRGRPAHCAHRPPPRGGGSGGRRRATRRGRV